MATSIKPENERATFIGKAALLASDLEIEINPRAYTWFRGTSAQLIAEGLIPDGFEWPIGDQHKTIEDVGFEHWLFRTRPEGHKGPKSSWINGDFWYLRRTLANLPRDGFMEAEIYAKKAELAAVFYRRSTEWHRICKQAYEARQDKRYMAFRSLVIPERQRGRGRPSKSVS